MRFYRSKIRRPLSAKIFAVIIVLTLIQAFIQFVLEENEFNKELFERKEHEIQSILVNFQEILQYLSHKNESTQIQRTIATLGAGTDIKQALLIDDNYKVLASTRVSLIGKNIDDLLPAEVLNKIGKFKQSFPHNRKNKLCPSSNNKNLYALSPIILSRQSDAGIHSDKLGILFLEYDLLKAEKINHFVMMEAFKPVIFSLFAAAFSLGLYFYFSITKRINEIHNAVMDFSLSENNHELIMGVTMKYLI